MNVSALIITYLLPVAALAQNVSPRLVTLERIEVQEGLVSPEISSRFGLPPAEVESRLRGAFAANLSAQLSSARGVVLTAREASLSKLMKEWEVVEKLGNPSANGAEAAVPGVDKADFVATATITDLTAQRDTLVLGGRVAAAKWRLMIEASFELVEVSTGRKLAVITERAEESGQSRGNANFTTLEIQAVNRGLASALATRIVDSLSPIRIVAIRGDDFIIDRGRSANVRVEDRYTVLEPAAAPGFGDAAFPVGTAVVVHVNEHSANLRLERPKGASAPVASTPLQGTWTVIKAAK